jgi:hypothetical protein
MSILAMCGLSPINAAEICFTLPVYFSFIFPHINAFSRRMSRLRDVVLLDHPGIKQIEFARLQPDDLPSMDCAGSIKCPCGS